jgi:hypothetical protein
MADQVDRHAVREDRNVGAVVCVEAAQKILGGLSASRVLSDEHPGRCLEQRGRPAWCWSELQLASRDR